MVAESAYWPCSQTVQEVTPCVLLEMEPEGQGRHSDAPAIAYL